MDNFKGDILNVSIFFALSDSRFSNLNQILSYPNKPYINGNFIYSALRWCTKSQFRDFNPCGWFCGPGSS